MNKIEQNGKSLESWIWDAACSIRGAKDAPKYKEFILPLIFTVIVHELLHFSVPNHGKLWKSLMRAHLVTTRSSRSG
jgi:HsdM N-terminal domain/Protein of unknown function DUF45